MIATVLARVPRLAWLVAGGLTAAGVGLVLVYHAGVSRGRDDERLHGIDSTKAVITDSLKVVTARVDTATAHVAVAEKRTAKVLAKRDSTAAHVAIVSDSQVRVDSGPILTVPPKIVEVFRADTAAINGLKTENTALKIQVVSLTDENGLLKRMVHEDSLEIGVLRKEHRPRFGFFAGVATGAGAVGAVVLTLFALHR